MSLEEWESALTEQMQITHNLLINKNLIDGNLKQVTILLSKRIDSQICIR